MTGSPVTLTPRLQSIMTRATEFQRERGNAFVGVEHVMIAILEDPYSVPTQVLDRFVDPARVQQALVGLIDSDYVMTGPDTDTDVPADVDRLAARRSDVHQAVATYGDPTPQSLTAREYLVFRLLLDGRFEDAREESARLCAGWEQVDPHAPRATTSRSLLVWALRELGRFTEAADEQRRVIAGSAHRNGRHSTAVLGSRLTLVVFLQRAGRVAEARDACAELEEACVRELGPEHVVTRGVVARLADLQGPAS